MQRSNMQMHSNPFQAAKAEWDEMTPEQKRVRRKIYEAEKASRQRDAIRRLQDATFANRIKFSRIPDEYRSASVEECPIEIQRYSAAIEAGSRESLMLRGSPGTGKTYSACAVMLKAAAVTTVRFTTVAAYLRDVNGVWINRDRTPAEVLHEYEQCGLLTIDDLGKEVPKETSLSLLWELIDSRKANGKPTIYTTNYDGRSLMERFAQGSDIETARATVDRLKESNVVLFDGLSRRKRCETVMDSLFGSDELGGVQ